MSSVKVVLRKKVNKDGTSPLALRITKDRKTSYIYLGYSAFEKDWDAAAQRVRRSHPNATRLNNFIIKKLAEASNTVLEIDTQQSDVSSDGIKRKIKPAADMMFFARADQYVQGLKDARNFNRWKTDVSRLRIFKEFVFGTEAIRRELSARALSRRHKVLPGVYRGTDVPFQKIDVALLTRFEAYVMAERGGGSNTAANFFSSIQAVFSQAIKEGVIDKKYSPFGRDKIQIKMTPSQKIGLSKEDIERLETVDLADPHHREVRDLWLVSFYFAGIRSGDVQRLRGTDFRDGRLYYVMHKNDKPVSLKVPEKALRILERYEAFNKRSSGFVFSFLEGLEHVDDEFIVQHRIAKETGKCNRLLRLYVAPAAQVESKITMHIARHTFATLAGDKVPIQMLQKLYRHSDVKTTIGYQSNFIHKDADDALDAVLDA